MSSPTLSQLREEIEEIGKDLKAFLEARDIIRRRMMEVRDQVRQLTPLNNWSGTDAVMGSLDLSIHAMERTISELRQIEKAMLHDRKFRVVDGGEDGQEG